jgi:hypothetical protein
MTKFPLWRDYLSKFIANQHDEKFKIRLNEELQLVDDILAVHLVVDGPHSPKKQVDPLPHDDHEESKGENVGEEGSKSCDYESNSHEGANNP